LYVSKEKFDSLCRSHCRQGDFVFQKIGNSIGDVAIMPSIDGQDVFLLSTNMMKISVSPEIADLKYVFYYFGQDRIRSYIKATAGGSAKPIFNFTTLKNFKIELPVLSKQREAVFTISKLDILIQKQKTRRLMLEKLKKMFIVRAQQNWIDVSLFDSEGDYRGAEIFETKKQAQEYLKM
jgi:type I restriction enzyme, S subunit